MEACLLGNVRHDDPGVIDRLVQLRDWPSDGALDRAAEVVLGELLWVTTRLLVRRSIIETRTKIRSGGNDGLISARGVRGRIG